MVRIITDIFIYLLLGFGLAWLFYYQRKKDIIGGYFGAMLIALTGCILGAFIFSNILKKIIDLLQEGFYLSNVNIIASVIGGYLFLYIFNRLNGDRGRKI